MKTYIPRITTIFLQQISYLKLGEKNRTAKHAKLKKRDILLSLLREMQKPEKIYKLLQDLTKITSGSAPLFINRIIPRYSNSDGGQIVDLYVGASNGATSQQQQLDSNYVFILMAKANQLVVFSKSLHPNLLIN